MYTRSRRTIAAWVVLTLCLILLIPPLYALPARRLLSRRQLETSSLSEEAFIVASNSQTGSTELGLLPNQGHTLRRDAHNTGYSNPPHYNSNRDSAAEQLYARSVLDENYLSHAGPVSEDPPATPVSTLPAAALPPGAPPVAPSPPVLSPSVAPSVNPPAPTTKSTIKKPKKHGKKTSKKSERTKEEKRGKKHPV